MVRNGKTVTIDEDWQGSVEGSGGMNHQHIFTDGVCGCGAKTEPALSPLEAVPQPGVSVESLVAMLDRALRDIADDIGAMSGHTDAQAQAALFAIQVRMFELRQRFKDTGLVDFGAFTESDWEDVAPILLRHLAQDRDDAQAMFDYLWHKGYRNRGE